MTQNSDDTIHGLTPPPGPDGGSGAPAEAFEQTMLTLPIDVPPAPEPTAAGLPPVPEVGIDTPPAPHASPSPVSQPDRRSPSLPCRRRVAVG